MALALYRVFFLSSLLLSETVAARFPFCKPSFPLQTIDGVTSLALCPQVIIECLKLLNTSDFRDVGLFWTRCFAHKSVCAAISLDSGVSRIEHPRESLLMIHVDAPDCPSRTRSMYLSPRDSIAVR